MKAFTARVGSVEAFLYVFLHAFHGGGAKQ